MKVLLIRPSVNTLITNLIRVEPLELEYLYATAIKEGHHVRIHDCVISNKRIKRLVKEYCPDIVGITCYINQKSMVVGMCREIKSVSNKIITVIGGVHASLNKEDFFDESINIIVHSGGCDTFRDILQKKELAKISGISYFDKKWVSNNFRESNDIDTVVPDRTFFYQNKRKYQYLAKGSYSLLKASISCPYKCNFCYCTQLNNGVYVKRQVDSVVEEIRSIDNDKIWIVDDTFYVDREDVNRFVELILSQGIKKQFIIYYRSDFISKNKDLISKLKTVGVDNIIVGLESIDDQKLESYNKRNSVDNNNKCLDVLRKNDITCTALFIIDVSAKVDDFNKLSAYIRRNKIKNATVSVFTPLPGTAAFEKYADKLISTNPRDYDFLHLVLKPVNMSKIMFYYHLSKVYIVIAMQNYRELPKVFYEYMGLLVSKV